ncbi:MAG: Holliday junction resolvase RuvX [Cryomorphaceae bacterium]|nr:MAG: Holliday junction resolvase RuvX [Cryomorphaceae bacterium]
MGRIVAIDYGRKRTGIAATDDLQLIASGVTTVSSHDLLVWLGKYFEQHKVDTLVVGDPVDLRGNPAEVSPQVNAFVRSFERRFPHVKVVRVDERFTSKMASQSMLQSGLKKKDRQNKALIDEISATLILQSYLESVGRVG